MNSHIIRIRCNDAKGIIYKVTEVLYRQNLNIINNAEHVDSESGHFFMRTEIEGHFEYDFLYQELLSRLPSETELKITERRKKRLVVLVTKESHCIGDLLIRCAYEDMEASIVGVMSNHRTLESLVSKFDIPFHHVSHLETSRDSQEDKIIDIIQNYNPDYIVLAKYMLILTPKFVKLFPHKIINIHHSFLPAFIGARPYQQAYNRGVKIVGATAHFVNDQLDEGPIISQGVIPVNHSDSAMDMVRIGRNVEKITLAQALTQVIEERVFVYGNKTIIFD